MKIAIDSGPLSGKDSFRGIGLYTKRLIDKLKDDKSINIEVADFKKIDLTKYDIAHYTYFKPFFLTLPLSYKTKTVVTIHDLIQLIYPEHYPPGKRGKLIYFIQKYLIKKVDRIITVSETSKKDIVRFLNIPQDKIDVIYEAADEVYQPIEDSEKLKNISERYRLPRKFVLYVGDVNYNKNLACLSDACGQVNAPLVIVGRQAVDRDFDRNHPENKPFVDFLKKYQDNPNVMRIGYVADEDLAVIFNLATVYCQPSFYEGFGLPVLEAFASGTPVVIAKTQALVEIAGDAALTADPKDYKDIAEKITQIIKNSTLSLHLVRKGQRRAREFSWEKAARETIEVYKKVIDDKR